jgi:MarR-like DNA-binding transcriptional regulator SgrR of sgrS sRNA
VPEGLQALDRYTLQVRLEQPDYGLIEFVTSCQMAVVARGYRSLRLAGERLDHGPFGGHGAIHA